MTPKRVRIKRGAVISQDFVFGLRWPECVAPGGGDHAEDPDMEFTIGDPGLFARRGWLELTAYGYGDMANPGGYGNGHVYVKDTDIEHLNEFKNLDFIGAGI